jgi:hypothetical protein
VLFRSEVILLAGLISNSSVLANAYRIFDEKLEPCIPCEPKGESQAKAAAIKGKKKRQ